MALLVSRTMKRDTKLVYSTDPIEQKKIEDEQKSSAKSGGTSSVDSRNFVAVFRIEKGGRGGKTVTVIDGLPKSEIFLKALTKDLKSKCGSGGTYSLEKKDGIIEIQGDKRDAIKKVFEQMKIKFKGH
jgi:translation initiation factor 1